MPSDGSPTFPCGPAPFLIAGPAGPLEAVAACPAPESERPASVVVLHPHSLHGGTLQNKVVHTVARSFTELGARSVRFNFRGVGKSAGTYANGVGETDDALAVLSWLRARRPNDAIFLAGFSFGAYVALRAAALFPLAGLLTIAPAVHLYDFSQLATPRVPWFLFQGERDEIVPAPAVREWAARQTPPPTLVAFPDAGHFFHQRLHELRAAITEHFAPLLPPH
ncbi:MAG: alpha/beta hydrolase [Gammaproteobacteria bacterium]